MKLTSNLNGILTNSLKILLSLSTYCVLAPDYKNSIIYEMKCLTNSTLASGVENTDYLTLAISLRHYAAFALMEEQRGEGIVDFKMKNKTSTVSKFSRKSFQVFGI